MHLDMVGEGVCTAVKIGDHTAVGGADLWSHYQERVLLCWGPAVGGGARHEERVGRVVLATVGRTIQRGCGGGILQHEGFDNRVGAGATADIRHQHHLISAGGGVDGAAVVLGGSLAVAKVPESRFAPFAGADGGDTVVGDGAEVVESHMELAVGGSDYRVEESERIAGAHIGGHGEEAGGIVDETEVAVVGGVGGRDGDGLGVVDGCFVDGVGIPVVVEAIRHGVGVGRHIATGFGEDVLEQAAEGEVGIAIVAALAAVVCGESYADGLIGVCAHVQTHGGPVFPQDIASGQIPAQLGIGNKVGSTAVGIDKIIILIKNLDAEPRLLRGTVLRVLQHGGIFKNEQVEGGWVDKEAVGDRLCLWRGAVGHPVAQTYRGLAALRNGTQQTAGADIVLGGVVVHRVAAEGTTRTEVENALIATRIGV